MNEQMEEIEDNERKGENFVKRGGIFPSQTKS